MLVASHITIGIAFSIMAMITLRNSALSNNIRLTRGLIIALINALTQSILYLIGNYIGNLLRFSSPTNPSLYNRTNALIMLGISTIVIIKILILYLHPKERKTTFNLQSNSTVIAMAFASGINVLLVGIGMGFLTEYNIHTTSTILPLLIGVFLLGYIGIMFGRQQVELRPKRWVIVASILILGAAIGGVINS